MATPDDPAPRTRDLIAGYLAGNREAERRLFEQHRQKLLERVLRERWVAGVLKQVTAEDLVDEVLVRALSAGLLEKLEEAEPGSLRRLLFKMLEDVVVDTYRRHGALKRGGGRAPRSYDGTDEQTQSGPERMAIASPDTTPTSKVRAGELLERCRSALDAREWEIWSLSEVEGFDSVEIARRFETTDSAIRGVLHRARKKLVEKLAHAIRLEGPGESSRS